MGQWWIQPGHNNGSVCIDDALLFNIDCSSVQANIYLVFWYGEKGEILYNHDDRPAVREPFYDITPYLPIFDKWLVAAETAVPPLTLPQAKFVKTGMVDALFASKRQLPIAYLGHVWDGSDAATGAMTDEIAAVSGTDAINSAVGALAASTQEAFDSLTAQTSTTIAAHKASADAAFSSLTDDTNSALITSRDSVNSAISGSIADVNEKTGTYAGQLADANHTGVLLQGLNTTGSPGSAPYSHTDAINTLVSHASNPSYIVYPTAPIDFPHPPMGAATPQASNAGSVDAPSTAPPVPINSPPVAATPASGPDITWPPLDGPPVTMTYVQFTTLLGMLTSRRRSLQIVRTQHKNNIAALTTVEAVAAYDITAGW